MSLDKLRELPEFKGASDAEIISTLAKTTQQPLADVASAFGMDVGGKWGNRLSASVDSYQAGLLGLGETVFGSKTLGDMRRRNEADAELSRSIAQKQGAIMSYKDIGGVGDFFDYAGGLAVDSAPYLAESLAGGLVARGLSTGLRGVAAAGRAADATTDAVRAGMAAEKALATRATLGGVAASYPSSVGDILQNQRDEAGTTDLGAAALGGIPYAALNAFGLEGALAKGKLARSGIQALDNVGGLRGGLLRTGASALKSAAPEGLSETGQELINQSFGRMAVNPDQTLFNPEANERYLESFVGGATMGGVFGGAAGGWRRSEGYLPPGQKLDDPSAPANLLGIDPQAAYGTQGDLFNGAGYDTTTSGSIDGSLAATGNMPRQPGMGQSLADLQSDLGELAVQANEAWKRGDRAGLEAVNAAMAQVQAQIKALMPRDDSRAPFLPSGVTELVSGQPVDLFNYELDNNLIPFVGDNNIDFPVQSGQGFEYTGGVDPEGLYTPLGEPVPGQRGLLSQVDRPPVQTQIPTVSPGPMQVDMFGNAAATAQDIENQNDPGAVLARQQWAKQQESINAARAVAQKVEADRAEAGRYNIKGDKAVELFATAKEMLTNGEIDQPTFNTWAGLLAAKKLGTVRGEIRNVVATKEQQEITAQANATETQTLIDNLKTKTNGTQTAQAVQGQTQESETLPAGTAVRGANVQASATPDTPAASTRGGLPAEGRSDSLETTGAKTVTIGRKGREKTVDAQQLSTLLKNAPKKDQQIILAAMGVDIDTNPTTGAPMLVARPEGPASYEEVGKLANMTRAGVQASLAKYGINEEVINRVAAAAAPESVSESELGINPEENGSGFRVETQLSKATGQGLIDDGVGETTAQRKTRAEADKLLKKSGTAVAKTNANPVATAEGRQQAEAITNRNIEAALQAPWAQEATEMWNPDNMEFSDLPAALVADWYLEYGLIVQQEGGLTREALVKINRLQNEIEDEYQQFLKYSPANQRRSDASVGGPTGGQTDRPGVGSAVERSGRRLETSTRAQPASEVTDVEAKPVTPFTGVISSNEQEASSKSAQSAAQPQNASVAESSRQPGPGQQKESVAGRSGQADRGVTTAEVVANLKEFLRKDALGRKVIVVQSVSDLPKGVRVSSKSKTQGMAIDDGPYGRVAYLIADNLTRDNIRAVFMHEVGSHLALDNMLNTQAMANLVEQIKNWAKLGVGGSTKQEHVLAAAAARRVQKSVKNPEHYRSELLAYFIEEAMGAGVTPTAIQTDKRSPLMAFLRKALALFKDIAAELGVSAKDITAQDIVDLAYGAAQLEMADTGPVASGESLTRENAKFSIGKPAYMNQAPSELWETAQGVIGVAKDWLFTRGAFTRDLLDAAEKLMPAAKVYREKMQRARVESMKLERNVASIVDEFSALPAHERGTGENSVNALIRKMTYENKWAFVPSWYPQAKVDPALAAWYGRLSKPAQDVIKRVFEHGHETLRQAKQAAIDSINSEVDPLIAKARADGDMETVKELERAKVEADGKFRRLMEIRSTTPYAPLRRFGNWAVVAKSQRFKDAEVRGDQAEMDRLSRDGNHYHVEFVSNQLAAAARAKKLKAAMGDVTVDHFERSDDRLLYGGESMFKAFSRFRALAREKMEDGDVKVVETLDKTLASMYMALVAETSARTSEFERKNVAGADMDMMRAFATQGRAMASFIGSLKTSGEIMDTLRLLKKQANDGGGRPEKSKLYNEITRRHAMGLDYEPNQLLDKSLAFNSYWSLITSPSHLLVNMTQPWTTSLPVLAGRFGAGRASSELIRAYKEIGRIATQLVDNPDAVKKLPKDVQGAIEELLNRGVIDISIGADLGSFTSGGDSNLSATTQKILRIPRTLVERGEMINRVATAVAAYRLAKGAKSAMSTEAAIDYADRVIYETHGDYSAFNSPRVMRNAVGRFATQFRKFQLIQLSLYARLFRDATSAMSSEERTAARRALGYSLATMFALGGMTALPGYTAISFVLGSALGFGDDDEPDDPEATVRRLLGGGPEADLILRGVPNLMGLNISSRVGAAGMLSILPYTDLEASRDGYKDILLGLAGPFFGGTLPKALDGVGLMSGGDYWKGLELLMPRGVADVLKGVRFASEGVSKRNGDVVLSGDEVSLLAGVAQAMGLPTTTITDNQMLRNSQYKADQFYNDRTTELKRKYVEAYRKGDGAKLQEVRQEWMDTQDARRRLGYKTQPLSTLLKAPQEQRKREARPLNAELIG